MHVHGPGLISISPDNNRNRIKYDLVLLLLYFKIPPKRLFIRTERKYSFFDTTFDIFISGALNVFSVLLYTEMYNM